MEREVGGGIGMGKTCKLKAVSFQCMTKFTTNLKKKKGDFTYSHIRRIYLTQPGHLKEIVEQSSSVWYGHTGAKAFQPISLIWHHVY